MRVTAIWDQVHLVVKAQKWDLNYFITISLQVYIDLHNIDQIWQEMVTSVSFTQPLLYYDCRTSIAKVNTHMDTMTSNLHSCSRVYDIGPNICMIVFFLPNQVFVAFLGFKKRTSITHNRLRIPHVDYCFIPILHLDMGMILQPLHSNCTCIFYNTKLRNKDN